MFKFRFKTLQSSLFISYSLLIFFILGAINLGVYFYLSKYIAASISKEQENLCKSIANSIDAEILKMNTVSMNVVYSNIIKSHFKEYESLIEKDTKNNLENNVEKYSNLRVLADAIITLIGPFQTVSQVNIYDFSNNMIGFGLFNGEAKVDVKEKPWYNQTILKYGEKVISAPDYMQFLDVTNLQLKDDKFVSLCRVYKNGSFERQGIIEVSQDCKIIFKFIEDILDSNPNLNVYIFDNYGRIIFPYYGNNSGKEYYNFINQRNLPLLTTMGFYNKKNNKNEIITYSEVNNSDWKVIVAEPQSTLYIPLRRLSIYLNYIFLISLLFSLFISYFISNKVTIPLKNLRKAIKTIDLNELSTFEIKDTTYDKGNLNEIESLYKSFNRLHDRLKSSLNQLIIAKNQEINAKFMALQSQMNPHFIFNSLANISAMAEEGMNKDIVKLCNNIAQMLRYVSDNTENYVTLFYEIEQTNRYLECMKIRYGSNLNYIIKIPVKMNNIKIPKLVVQPLVENCIKHAFSNLPPWEIKITGDIEDNKWFITICDNGIGFSESSLQTVYEFIQKFNSFDNIPELKIEGMGLLNIYIRLKLLYKDNIIFSVKNNEDSGASITIGGSFQGVLEEIK